MLRGHHLYVFSPTDTPSTPHCSLLPLASFTDVTLPPLRLPLRDVLLRAHQPSSYDLTSLYLEYRVSRYHLLHALRSSYPVTAPALPSTSSCLLFHVSVYFCCVWTDALNESCLCFCLHELLRIAVGRNYIEDVTWQLKELHSLLDTMRHGHNRLRFAEFKPSHLLTVSDVESIAGIEVIDQQRERKLQKSQYYFVCVSIGRHGQPKSVRPEHTMHKNKMKHYRPGHERHAEEGYHKKIQDCGEVRRSKEILKRKGHKAEIQKSRKKEKIE